MTSDASEPRKFSQPTAEKPLRVLVVDDEPLIRWSLGEVLGARGCHVVESGDARGAGRIVRETPLDFDVVLLDYQLPDGDGLSLLPVIRRRSPGARVILMTAFGTPELLDDALAQGASKVLGKPFDMDALADLVAPAGPNASDDSLAKPKPAAKASEARSARFRAAGAK